MRWTNASRTVEYYLRELGGEVILLAEATQDAAGEKPWCGVLRAQPEGGNRWRGDLILLPKGTQAGSASPVTLQRAADGSSWTLTQAGQPAERLERDVSDFPANSGRPWGAGFYDERPDATAFRMTGTWRCDDGGTYYVRHLGDQVVWMGEHPTLAWCNVFFGRLADGVVTGQWFDVPKAAATGRGTLTLNLGRHPTVDAVLAGALAGAAEDTRLTRTAVSGGFGGGTWDKVDAVTVCSRFVDVEIVRNHDVGSVLNPSGDEPYLLAAAMRMGGDEFSTVFSLLDVRDSERIHIETPHVLGAPYGIPKNNITWEEDLPPGTVRPVPDPIGYHETVLRTIVGLQPNSASARSLNTFAHIGALMEEASTSNTVIAAGWRAAINGAPAAAEQAMRREVRSLIRGAPFDTGRVRQAITDAMTQLVTDAATEQTLRELPLSVGGAIDRDTLMGTITVSRSFGQLRDVWASGALREQVVELPASRTAQRRHHWRVRHRVGVHRQIGAVAGPVRELLLMLRTGDDDKRRDSVVRGSLLRAGGPPIGPFDLHAPGERFPDRTRVWRTLSLPEPVPAVNFSRLDLAWQAGVQGSNLDTWALDGVRVVGFDAQGQRVEIGALARGVRLRRDQTVQVPLR